MISEMTSISNVYGLVVGLDTFSDDTIKYTMSIAISLAVFTWFYTSLAGLPASIITDKFQAYLMFSLVFILLIVACVNPNNQITKEEFAVASNWTTDGFVAAVTLIIAVVCAEMFNQGTWQRVWAANSVPEMRKGFMLGSFLVFLLMMFFGIMGMIAYGKLLFTQQLQPSSMLYT
jgi:Na+/proline symporter